MYLLRGAIGRLARGERGRQDPLDVLHLLQVRKVGRLITIEACSVGVGVATVNWFLGLDDLRKYHLGIALPDMVLELHEPGVLRVLLVLGH